MSHTTVRMVERKDGSGYRRVGEAEYQRRAATLRAEGVDGDEETNTVTYWYTPRNEED